MRILRFFLLPALAVCVLALNGCSDKTDVNVIRKTGIVMDGNQENPAKPGAWNGLLDVEYNKDTRTLYYKITWNSLSGAPTAAHIHGAAKRGVNAGVIQTFSGFPAAAAGTFSGSVFFDGVALKETDLFAGELYVNVHTALNPGGEIRGQIEF
ncbi:MAG: CHRD domain-containing protein [Gemmatimonadaceae bacterium]|nr:CHRD domain-containing protein [Chitinophagaceae bacterium]